jgi:hypothetical protein
MYVTRYSKQWAALRDAGYVESVDCGKGRVYMEPSYA